MNKVVAKPAENSTDPVQADGAWHALPAEQTLDNFQTSSQGLDPQEASKRLGQYGPNRLDPPRRRGPLIRFLSQFNNVLIYVLLLAALVTAALAHWEDTSVILAVVVVNAIIGFVQEGRAERALEAIRNMLSLAAIVERDGRKTEIPAEDVVPGDIIHLQSGDKVPADLRLIRVKGLQIQEAILTGESVPVDKDISPVAKDAALGDRFSMAYSGTMVTHGQGCGVVVATGAKTEIGRISALLSEVSTLTTPLLRQMSAFGRKLSAAIMTVACVTFAIGVWVHGRAAADMFVGAVALAVAAIPEGLPAIMTIALATGVQRMASRRAIIRRLPVVEALGSVSVICSDKTGTLTRNEMTVQSLATGKHLYAVTGTGYRPEGGFELDGKPVTLDDHPGLTEMARGALLCSDAGLHEDDGQWVVDGDPTEGALVALAMKAELEPGTENRQLPRHDVIPFESEHRFMATLHHHAEGHGFIYVKGAPERILAMCNSQGGPDYQEALDRPYWEDRMQEMAENGQRVLALAFRPTHNHHHQLVFDDVKQDLVLIGLYGLVDPPREEAIAAVAKCRAAGITVKMITGDHAITAGAIARKLGLGDGERVVSGHELDALDDEALRNVARQSHVFARTSPEHKLRLVKALQAEGHVVAMTGDGVNDAPALKRADVGVAMGQKGNEAAKEAAEMVLVDDNFASIAAAVEEGRTVYDNLVKSILFILPSSGGEALTIVMALALGQLLPITAPQILWVNMITAVTLALALAFEPAENNVMKRQPRRRDAPLLSGFLIWRTVFVSLILVVGVFGVFVWSQNRGAGLEVSRTLAVNTLVMFELFYLFNTRFLTASALTKQGLTGSRAVLIAVVLVVVFQLIYTYAPPMQYLFESAAISPLGWALAVGVGFSVFVLVEVEKAVLRHWQKRKSQGPNSFT